MIMMEEKLNDSNIETFNTYFEILPANTDKLKLEVYKLRYQVYCLEKRFEDPNAYSGGLEYDEYDRHSSHSLIRHIESNSYIATTRLILPNYKNLNTAFPIEKITKIYHSNNIARCQIAELSRFCISKKFRRRVGEKDLIITLNNVETKRPNSPNLTLGLFASAIKMSAEHNIYYWYALMEPTSKRIASALGIEFIPIGSAVNYRGSRTPYIINIPELLKNVKTKNINYWRLLTNDGQYFKT